MRISRRSNRAGDTVDTLPGDVPDALESVFDACRLRQAKCIQSSKQWVRGVPCS